VTATISSNIYYFTLLDAARYARAHFAVISIVADPDNPISMHISDHQWRAPSSEARLSLAGTIYEDRRALDLQFSER
jgi:hypothetical protein